MKSKEELRKLYDRELMPALQEMEGQRKAIKKWRLFAIVAGVIAFIFYQISKNTGGWAIAGIVICVIGAIIFAVMALIRYQDYKQKFKANVVSKLVQLVNPDYKYNATSHINGSSFTNSGIFPKPFDRISGDDMITGRVDKTNFQFSELHTEYKTESRDDDGNRETKWHSIFRGIFFSAEFNKHLGEQTFIFPEKDRHIKNLFGKEHKKSKNYGELVKLENPIFEGLFSVYGSSQQEARYILTPTMMEAIVHVHNAYTLNMYFSFKGENVYFAMPMRKNMFEPKIGKNGIQYKDLEEMFVLFDLIETIIHEMNLNTRIWTKS